MSELNAMTHKEIEDVDDNLGFLWWSFGIVEREGGFTGINLLSDSSDECVLDVIKLKGGVSISSPCGCASQFMSKTNAIAALKEAIAFISNDDLDNTNDWINEA
jgi:hypothetical protein